MLLRFLSFLFLSGFCAPASAAIYRLTITNSIDRAEDFDFDTYDYVNGITTPHGVITAGSTITLELTYDTDAFTQVDGGEWSGGSYVQYSTDEPAILSITVSSGYSYNGTMGGGTSAFLDVTNQYTAHDQVNFKKSDGNLFIQFNDFSGSQTFTSHPMTGQALEDTHAAFVAAVGSGVMELANGLPASLPGLGSYARFGSSSPGTVSLSLVTPVPEPGHGVMAATAILGLLARRRRA
jgi:hypothetical protein